MLQVNPIIKTDSYKYSHFGMMPPGATRTSAYVEARRGPWAETVFTGLQALLKTDFATPITREDVEEAEDIVRDHGLVFNRAGYLEIVNKFGGFWPVTIFALLEGTVAPLKTAQVVIETEPGFQWLTTLETSVLRSIWYPSSVATLSREAKKDIYAALLRTSEDPGGQIGFKLHDFGARGASSGESAMLGGMGHLINFLGTDTIEAIYGHRKLYHEKMAGFSIPASEHSTITSWGMEGETAAYRNILNFFPTGMVACVSDSYDIMNAVNNIWGGTLAQEVLARNGVLVIRPDSGDPTKVPLDVIESAMARFGATTNSKGFRVLNNKVRVIQGDGMNAETIKQLLANAIARGISVDNFAMGMGGGLLQKVDRDTLGYALKVSAIEVDGEWKDVFKDPATDPGKKSKAGRLAVVRGENGLETIRAETLGDRENLLKPVWKNGELLVDQKLSTIRARAAI